MRCVCSLLFVVFFLLCGSANALQADSLLQLSLEELMEVEVTSAGKKAQPLSHTAAAVTVLTREDIRRSTATTIPGVLRQVPGLNVSRINAGTWAVSARGFNERFSNKLLVLIDGRPIYTPLFSGVYWPAHETLLRDIERIEVIRGPAGATWGANAFNGVINIITRHAAETTGVLAQAIVGEEERAGAAVRYGGGDEDLQYRVHLQYADRDEQTLHDTGGPAGDSMEVVSGGFRVDAGLGARDTLMVTGGFFDEREREPNIASLVESPFFVPGHNRLHTLGGHMLARWERDFGASGALSVQAFVDHIESRQQINNPFGGLGMVDRVTTYDLEGTYRFSPFARHDVVVGAEVRRIQDYYDSTDRELWSYSPERRVQNLYAAFIQDEVEVMRDVLWLTLGAKLEHNVYTGLEFSPTAKALWKLDDGHMVWGSASRAVRTPSRQEHDTERIFSHVELPEETGLPFPVPLFLVGSDDYRAEEVWALEAGYRARPWEAFSFDVSVFYNFYDSLRTYNGPFFRESPTPHVVSIIANDMKGEGYGLEVSATLDVGDWWRIKGAYAHLETNLWLQNDASANYSVREAEGQAARNSLYLQSRMDLPHDMEFDLFLRTLGPLPFLDTPGYTELDLRLGWEVRPGLEVALVGRNLLSTSHLEYFDNFLSRRAVEIDRAVFTRITWSF